jgi:hypothetical protein
MSATSFTHKTRNLPVTVGTAAASSTAMLMNDMAAGTVHVDGVTATHTLAVYGSGDGVTFVPLYGFDGQAATVSVNAAGGSVVLPDAVYPLRFVKLVSGTDLGTAASVVISLKS